jgi:hypothetical protein
MMAARVGRLPMEQYRELYVQQLDKAGLRPDELYGVTTEGDLVLLEDGDTLCCSCARAKAAKGECHRVWAAELLVKAGWRVILDGEELSP